MPSVLSQLKSARTWTKLKVYFLGGIALSVIGGAGFSIYKILSIHMAQGVARELAQEPEPKIEEEEHHKREVASFTYGYDLRNISIPLANRNATQIAYAQFNLRMDCPNADAKRTLEVNRAKILDKVFEVATQFYIEDFKNPQGYRRFKDALVKAMGSEFRAHTPRQIAIENWVVN